MSQLLPRGAKGAILAVVVWTAMRLSAETVWLSSLDVKQVTAGWSAAKADRGVAVTPLKDASRWIQEIPGAGGFILRLDK